MDKSPFPNNNQEKEIKNLEILQKPMEGCIA
jgi:hypothetical protein